MKLKSNQLINLQALLSVALNTYYKNIHIVNAMEDEELVNVINVNFTRKFSLNHLRKLNEYFGTDIRNKEIKYCLKISFDNPESSKLFIEDIKNKQLSMFNEDEEKLQMLIDKYNDNVTNRLLNNLILLMNTFIEGEIKDWTFYYIAKNKHHVGFANANAFSNESIKILLSDIHRFKDEVNANFYDDVLKIKGTENDAMCLCLRRNYNSKYVGNWKICEFGIPINELCS